MKLLLILAWFLSLTQSAGALGLESIQYPSEVSFGEPVAVDIDVNHRTNQTVSLTLFHTTTDPSAPPSGGEVWEQIKPEVVVTAFR